MGDFAKNLKELMQRHQMTAAELSVAAKVPKSSLSQWLSGRDPKLSLALVRVARVLDTTVDHLISGQDAEIDAIKAVVSALEEQFVTVHQGTYRLTLEKQTAAKRRKGES